MDYLRTEVPTWITDEQYQMGLDGVYLFSNRIYGQSLFETMTQNWEWKRPIWLTIALELMTETFVSGAGTPTLDLHLIQQANNDWKTVTAIETTDEQCSLFNKINTTLVCILNPGSVNFWKRSSKVTKSI